MLRTTYYSAEHGQKVRDKGLAELADICRAKRSERVFGEETDGGPTLYPSIGSWQLPYWSHYWIYQGEIIWSERWTPEQIAAGRRSEEARARTYYDTLDRRSAGRVRKLREWLRRLFLRTPSP